MERTCSNCNTNGVMCEHCDNESLWVPDDKAINEFVEETKDKFKELTFGLELYKEGEMLVKAIVITILNMR